MNTELLIPLIDFSITLIILTSKYFTKKKKKRRMATKSYEMKKYLSHFTDLEPRKRKKKNVWDFRVTEFRQGCISSWNTAPCLSMQSLWTVLSPALPTMLSLREDWLYYSNRLSIQQNNCTWSCLILVVIFSVRSQVIEEDLTLWYNLSLEALVYDSHPKLYQSPTSKDPESTKKSIPVASFSWMF